MTARRPIRVLRLLLALSVPAATAGPAVAAWNNPYPDSESGKNILYSAFTERPKHLDPARSYSANEYIFLAQVYEPPFQYHYLKRPYVLEPLTAEAVPEPVYLDARGRRLPAAAPAADIARSVYTIRIKPGIRYQPHPCFAKGADGAYLYHALSADQIDAIDSLDDFAARGTRELVAADYVNQIKRLVHPGLHSPLGSLMSQYIVGLRELGQRLQREYAANGKGYLDLRRYPLAGVKLVDRYAYEITIYGKNPQFVYWLALPFFAPMPPEAEQFFAQPGLDDKNLTLDWYPVGSGAYMLTVNDPNRKMVLERNPNYHDERYPSAGEPGDRAAGLLGDAGKRLPFIDKVVFSLEKEQIPYWNKFLQGYYDRSGISAESFDQAVRVGASGDTTLTEEMRARGIELLTSVETSIFYFGFNMLDPVVGGYSEHARKLRRAISIAIDFEEFISIFRNGRGIAAQGPIPPGIFGYRSGRAGMNPYVYDWVNGEARRKPIAEARRLLAEAGYPNGRDAETGKPLLLYFDTTGASPEDKARLEWIRKQFKKLNLEVVIRATDYNRFQDKMLKGTAQMFMWGWNADYPDPENFLFLLYGPNQKVERNGENAANYDNPEYNRLFEQVKNMENSPDRLRLIERMVGIAQRDAPWAWGFNPKQFILQHSWVHNTKPNLMANNTVKYQRLDPALRQRLREQWNRPVLWPLAVVALLMLGLLVPAVVAYRARERSSQR